MQKMPAFSHPGCYCSTGMEPISRSGCQQVTNSANDQIKAVSWPISLGMQLNILVTQAHDVLCQDRYYFNQITSLGFLKFTRNITHHSLNDFSNCVQKQILLTASFSSSSFSLCHSASASVGSAPPVIKSLLCVISIKIVDKLEHTKVIQEH